MCVGVSVWLGWSGIRVAGLRLPELPARNFTMWKPKPSNKTFSLWLIIELHSSNNKKWNKIGSDIKLVFYSSNITIMHGPNNIRFVSSCSRLLVLSLPLPVPCGDRDVCRTPGGRNKWLSPCTRRFPPMWELYTSSDRQLNSEHHLTNCDHLMCYSYDTVV